MRDIAFGGRFCSFGGFAQRKNSVLTFFVKKTCINSIFSAMGFNPNPSIEVNDDLECEKPQKTLKNHRFSAKILGNP